MITFNGQPVEVIIADMRLKEATIRYSDGKVRLVSMWKLKGRGGDLEVARTCREAALRSTDLELKVNQ